MLLQCFFFFFFFNDTATTEIYTLSLHDALPILYEGEFDRGGAADRGRATAARRARRHGSCGNRGAGRDRKSTRLNSSHSQISYAVFCLKKKKKKLTRQRARHLHHSCNRRRRQHS